VQQLATLNQVLKQQKLFYRPYQTNRGFIEGIAEAAAMITKVFSGAISDWLGRRKMLVVIGYGLAAFTKPVFPLANSVG
jgi:hypothetical protein